MANTQESVVSKMETTEHSEALKPSGVPWIGDIPEAWEVRKLKSLILALKSGGTPESGVEKFYCENGVPWVTIADMSSTDYIYKTSKTLTMAGVANKKLVVFPAGTILYSIYATIGKVSEIKVPSTINQAILALIVNENITFKQFFKYSLITIEDYIISCTSGNTQFNLNAQKVNNLLLPLPPLAEQEAIARYLDDKCALVDATVEKEKLAIAKLKEYKQAVITEAVTKGLNPHAPLKPSGIPWIGDIPEAWEVRKLKWLGELSSNGVDKKTKEGEPLFKSVHYMDVYNNSQKKIENSEDYLVISTDASKSQNCTLRKADVLFTNSSEVPEDMGHSTVIGEDLINTLFGYHLMRFRPSVEISLEYEKFLFGSFYMRKWFEYRAVGMTRYGLSRKDFTDALIILPPVPEQEAIARHLDDKCSQVEGVIAQKEAIIVKLNDYKKSLIYECVTGKKKVPTL
jgi:restriction endonuclease S subunit